VVQELMCDLHHPVGAAFDVRRDKHIVPGWHVVAKGIVFAKLFELPRVEGTEWPLAPTELLKARHKRRHEAF
jgi:hypothetical protein